MKRTALLAVALLALLAAACGDDDSDGSSSSTNDDSSTIELDGRTFLSQSVTEDDEARPLVPGSRIRMTFDDGRIGASVGCNSMSGAYTLDGSTLVIADGLATTEMGCSEELQAQDEWLAEFLQSRPTVALAGNELTLTSDTTVITLLDREVADPDRPLTDTVWTLESIVDNDAVSSVPGGVTATLEIAADGTVKVNAGCNTGGGTAEVSDDTIEFGPLALTLRACGPDESTVESAVTSVLTGSVDYEIEAGQLRLRADDGSGLDFRAP